MTRLVPLSEADLAEADRKILRRPINLHRVLANSIPIGQAFVDLAEAIRHRGTLSPRLRELVILQVGYLASCAYEVSHHVKIGLSSGLSAADIHAITIETTGGCSGLGELERLALRAAREIASDMRMEDATWKLLSKQLDDAQMLELGVIAAFYTAVVRVLGTFDIEVENEYRDYLAVLPLLHPLDSVSSRRRLADAGEAQQTSASDRG